MNSKTQAQTMRDLVSLYGDRDLVDVIYEEMEADGEVPRASDVNHWPGRRYAKALRTYLRGKKRL